MLVSRGAYNRTHIRIRCQKNERIRRALLVRIKISADFLMTLQASFMGPQHAAIHKTNRQSRIALCLLSLSPWLPSIATPPHGAPSRPSLVFQIHRQSSKIAMQPSAVYDSLNIQGLRACCLRWECPDLWISRGWINWQVWLCSRCPVKQELGGGIWPVGQHQTICLKLKSGQQKSTCHS